jgi:aryl-alcohol dehydrogenase-like predicted oxidoreductase
VISVGSWQTFEKIPFEDTVDVLAQAFEVGINFFDTARYAMVAPSERGEGQPIPPGSPHSEVIFGRAMAETGRDRSEYVLSDKVWFDTYPEQSFVEQVDASVRRLGLGYIDVIFCQVPPPGLDIETLAREMGGVVEAGRAKTWGTINWSPEQLTAAAQSAEREGFAPPSLVELKYSMVRREPAEADDYERVYREHGVRVHASNVFEGGLLTGKYGSIDALAARRILPADDHGAREGFIDRRDAYLALAEELDTTPAALALAFCISNEDVASALIGSTRPAQIVENAKAVELAGRSGAEIRSRLDALLSAETS